MYKTNVSFAGRDFVIDAPDFKVLMQKVAHFEGMNYRVRAASRGLSKDSLLNVRWNYRVVDDNPFYELRATIKLDDEYYPVQLKISELKKETDYGEKMFVRIGSWVDSKGEAHANYWKFYDKDTEETFGYHPRSGKFVPFDELKEEEVEESS